MSNLVNAKLLENIRQLLVQSRASMQHAVNSTMVYTYWHVGELIVEDEQQGKVKAVYGEQQLQRLSEKLLDEFGKGFDVTNLRNMRRFYLAYPI